MGQASGESFKNFGINPPSQIPMLLKDVFKCDCAQEVPQAKVKEHYEKCLYMQSKYINIFQAFDTLADDINPNNLENELKNIQTILGYFANEVRQKLKE